MQQNVFISKRISKLKAQLIEVTKYKGRKRKQIQHSRTIEYSVVAMSVAVAASAASQLSKKGGGGSSDKQALPAKQRCGTCRETGHNARTCKKDEEEDSESNASKLDDSSIESVK